MAGKLQITGLHVTNCGVAISLPAQLNAEVSIAGTTIKDCGMGIWQRDPGSLAAQMGFPVDTPPELIIEAAKTIQSRGGNVEDLERSLKDMPIWAYLIRARDVATTTTALIGAAKAIAAAFM